jgi:hypothetical protein
MRKPNYEVELDDDDGSASESAFILSRNFSTALAKIFMRSRSRTYDMTSQYASSHRLNDSGAAAVVVARPVVS